MTLARHPLALAALALVALALSFVAPAAQAAPTFPALAGQRVVDDAHILSPQTVSDITGKLAALEAKTNRQVVVVTLPSLQGYDIQDYGYQLGRYWGIGQKGQDNGLLFIIAPNDHRVRIEVGYGLEPIFTDALSNQILQTNVIPKLRGGDANGAVSAGTDAIVAQLSADQTTAQANVQQATHVARPHGSPFGAIFGLIVLFIIFSSLFRSHRGGGGGMGWLLPMMILSSGSRGGWGGGGFGGGGDGGGGGFSGGGGSFGGGGASGSW